VIPADVTPGLVAKYQAATELQDAIGRRPFPEMVAALPMLVWDRRIGRVCVALWASRRTMARLGEPMPERGGLPFMLIDADRAREREPAGEPRAVPDGECPVVFLPDQGYLQRMIGQARGEDIVLVFWTFIDDYLDADKDYEGKTADEIWLDFYMSWKHGKTWREGAWQTSEI